MGDVGKSFQLVVETSGPPFCKVILPIQHHILPFRPFLDTHLWTFRRCCSEASDHRDLDPGWPMIVMRRAAGVRARLLSFSFSRTTTPTDVDRRRALCVIIFSCASPTSP